VELTIDGWELAWARLLVEPGAAGAAEEARGRVAEAARGGHRLDELGRRPTAVAVRRLFREAGTDPTRYRPSSEALLRRVLKGEELPAIHPLVDLNNCLSVELAVPSCVIAEGSVRPPVRLRVGRPGERMDSLRGDLDLEGKPLLEDVSGPFGTPITDSRRVKVEPATETGWLVAYLPRGVVGQADVDETLASLGGIARVTERFASGAVR
jgi:DNA/RNA-binding domain of Phe-tRNA-synthetase-like protein